MLTEDLREKIKELAYECPDVKELQFIRDGKDDIDITDITGEGLVNYVVAVRPAGQPAPVVVFKHGLPYATKLPFLLISQNRTMTEFDSYEHFNKVCPGSTPRPYCYSRKNSIFAMEYLDGYETLLDILMTKSVNWHVLEQLISTIATIHSSTHRLNIGESEFAELQRKFPMSATVSVIGEYIYEVLTRDNPNYPTNVHLREIAVEVYNDDVFVSNVRKLRDMYFNRRDCLAHYDLHAGSVLIKGSSVKIIDNEFSMVGAAGLDMASLVNHFIYNYLREMTIISEDTNHDTTAAEDMLKALRFTINLYVDRISTSICKEGGASDFNQEVFISDIAGFMGYHICQRCLGLFPTKDAAVYDAVRLRALQIGVYFVRKYPVIRTVEQIVDAVLPSA